MNDRTIELRVHGVSGTSPGSLLDRPLVTQVAGDAIAGFYRPRLPDERYDAASGPFAPRQEDAPLLEGYNWGGLTSGSPGRALWLLLLPFTLVNVAPRARPDETGPGDAPVWRARAIWYFSRLIALGLTLLLVITAAGISEDLVWWQCRRGGGCAGLPSWVSHPLESVASGTTLVVAALLPAAALVTLWLISERTIDRYEDVEVAHMAARGAQVEAADALEVTLRSRWMWRNEQQVRRLRAIHMQAGLATIVFVTSATSGSGHTLDIGRISVSGTAVPLLVVLHGAAMLAVPAWVGREAHPRLKLVSRAVWVLLVWAALVQGQGLVGRDVDDPPRADTGRVLGLPDYESALLWLLLGMFVLLLLLAVSVVVSAHEAGGAGPSGTDHQPLSPGLRGWATAFLAGMGTLLALVFSASAYSYAAAWLLSGSVRPGPGEVSAALTRFDLPDSFRVATVGFLTTVCCAAVIVSVAVLRTIWGYGPLGLRVAHVPDGAVDADYEEPRGDPANHQAMRETGRRRRSIERAVYLANLVEGVPVVVAAVVVVGAVITLVYGVVVLAADLFRVEEAEDLLSVMADPESRGWRWTVGPGAQGWGAYLAVLFLLLTIAVAAAAFRVPQTRRSVGIVWDVASFWPRSCHPLAAPCYAERAVPDLVTRVHWHHREGRTVVLAGHSQGSVLSAAAVLRLSRGAPDDMPALALLTFGCVLRRLYGRFFPVYFGPRQLADLQDELSGATSPSTGRALPRWRNLWRYTDYLGGQVTSGPPQLVPARCQPPSPAPAPWELHSPDPPSFRRPAGSTTYSRPHRHSDFWSDESGSFQCAVVELARTLRPVHGPAASP